MGGSNQSLFLITALFVGQGDILGQGSAAIPLLIVGLLLSYAAAPGWTELVLMSPNRVGGNGRDSCFSGLSFGSDIHLLPVAGDHDVALISSDEPHRVSPP